MIGSSKFDRVRSAYFADIGDFDAVLTDSNVDAGLRRRVEESGVRIVTR